MPAALLNKRSAVAVDESDLISAKMSTDIRDQSAVALLPRQKSLPTPDYNDSIIDRFISLAKRLFHVPIALVTIADIDCSLFKANTGLEGAIEVIEEASFCAYAILPESPDVFIVNDGREDIRFFSNPLITGPPFIRFYAGAALLVNDVKIGAICIIDTEPRPLFSRDNALALLDLGHALSNLVQERKEKAMKYSKESAKMMSDMMRSLHYSVVRTNKTTHQLLKNIEEKKKSLSLCLTLPSSPSSSSSPSSYLSPSSLLRSSSSSSSFSSCNSLQHTTHTTHTAAIQLSKVPQSKLKIHPWGDKFSGEKNSIKNKIDVNLDKEGEDVCSADLLGSETNDITEKKSVKRVEDNHLEVQQGQGQGHVQGEELGQGQWNKWGGEQGLEQESGQGQGQVQVHLQAEVLGQGQRQGQGERSKHEKEHEHDQWQPSNAHALTTPAPSTDATSAPDDIDLVSDLENAVDHLTVPFESNICLIDIEEDKSIAMLESAVPMAPCDVLKTINRARSTLANNTDKTSNVVWNVDQRFLTVGSKHCIQLKILNFLLLTMVERFVEMWHEVRVCIYFQKIEGDYDSCDDERYNKVCNSIQSNHSNNNNNNDNDDSPNNNNNDNKNKNGKEQESDRDKGKEKGQEKGKEKEKYKKKKHEKLDWLKGNLVIQFGYSKKKILIEECSSTQGMTSLCALHRVLTDAGGRCTVKHGAQNNALGSGTPLIGARDGTVLENTNSALSYKTEEADKRGTRQKKDVGHGGERRDEGGDINNENKVKRRVCGECEEGLTCWLPCNVLLMNSYEERSFLLKEHSSFSQERCPSERIDRLMDLFIDSTEIKHYDKKYKLSTSCRIKRRKKSKSEAMQKYEKMATKNNVKNKRKFWIKILEFKMSSLNLNRKVNSNEIRSFRDNSGVAIGHKNGNILKESYSALPDCIQELVYSTDSSRSRVQSRHDEYRNFNDEFVLHNSNANTICKINYNNHINKKFNDNKNSNNDINNKLNRLECKSLHGRMRKGSTKGKASYRILDCGNLYWQSKPILSPTATASTSSSSPSSSIAMSPSYSPSSSHLMSPTSSPSPSPSPSLTPTHSSSFSSSSPPIYSTSTSSSPSSSSYASFYSSSSISSIPLLLSNFSQETKGPYNLPNRDENGNNYGHENGHQNGSGNGSGKKENRTIANNEQTKLRASLHALTSAAMLSSLVDDDLKEYNYTVSWDERRKNKPSRSRRNSFSSAINSLSKSFRNSFTTTPTISLSD